VGRAHNAVFLTKASKSESGCANRLTAPTKFWQTGGGRRLTGFFEKKT
jgi:hypothetical protein